MEANLIFDRAVAQVQEGLKRDLRQVWQKDRGIADEENRREEEK